MYPNSVRHTATKQRADGICMILRFNSEVQTHKRRKKIPLKEKELSDKVQSGNPKVSREFRRDAWKSPVVQSGDDRFIHVDLFVFPPLAVHNKGGGWNFKESPTVRKWPSILPAQDRVLQCLWSDNDLQGLSVPPLSAAHWRQTTPGPTPNGYKYHSLH